MLDFSFLAKDPGDIIIKNSGGPDCAIIFYGAAKYVVENNLPIKFYHMSIDSQTKFFYIHHAKKVINFIEQEFGVPCEEHYTRDNVAVGRTSTGMPTNYRETQQVLVEELFNTYPNIKYLMAGSSNMLPQSLLLEEQANGNWLNARPSPDPERDGSTTNSVFGPYFNSNGKSVGKFYGPFINGDKRDVKKCYDSYGVVETLFPLTRSCEAHTEWSHYNGQEHCGECLFCFERYTIFGRL